MTNRMIAVSVDVERGTQRAVTDPAKPAPKLDGIPVHSQPPTGVSRGAKDALSALLPPTPAAASEPSEPSVPTSASLEAASAKPPCKVVLRGARMGGRDGVGEGGG